MAQEYKEIVCQWYIRLRPEFLRRITAKYSGLSQYDAENLYQDTFIAVQENIQHMNKEYIILWWRSIIAFALKYVKRFHLLAILMIAFTAVVEAESVNEIFLRINYDEVYSFDKIENPTPTDSLQYIQHLAYISSNYCDSTTVKYHRDIINRIFSVFPYVRSKIQPDDNLNRELLSGIINIITAEDFYSNQFEEVHMLNELGTYLIFQIFPYVSNEDKTYYIGLAEGFCCTHPESMDDIIKCWLACINSMENEDEYKSHFVLVSNIHYFLASNGEFEKATVMSDALLSKCNILFDENSDEKIACLSIKGGIAFNSCDFENAINNLTERIRISKILNYPEKEFINLYRDYSRCLLIIGKYDEALMYAQKVIDLTGDKNNIVYVNDLKHFYHCQFEIGEETEAINHLKDLTDYEKDHYPGNLIQSYSNLSVLYRLSGDMVNSLKYGQMSVLEWESHPSEEYEDLLSFCHTLVNLGNAYATLGEPQSFFLIFHRANQIFQKLKEIRRYDIQRYEIQIMALSQLARELLICNKIEECEDVLNRALELSQEYYGENSPGYFAVYAKFAAFKSLSGDNSTAADICKYILTQVNPESQLYYRCLSAYSDYCLECGNYIDAYDSIVRAYYGTHSIEDLINQSRCEYYLGKFNDMKLHHIELFEQSSHEVIHSFLSYNDIQRRAFWNNRYGYWFQEELPSLIINSGEIDDTTTRLLYDATILSKGILLSTDQEIAKLIRMSKDQSLICKYNKFRQLHKEHISKKGNQKDFSYFNEIYRLESEIMTKLSEMNSSISTLHVTSRDIQKVLNEHSVAIEFIEVNAESHGSKKYYALILDSNEVMSPQLVSLFDEQQLREIDKDKYYSESALSQLIWGHLYDIIRDKEQIYFSPTGVLNNIAVEHLPSPDGNGYINENHSLIRLSNTREIVTNANHRSIKNFCGYGGMLYDADLSIIEIENKCSLPYSSLNYETIAANRRGHTYLPATKIEVEMIDSIMKVNNILSEIHVGYEGTESSVKSWGKGNSPSILHIASHGIYYSEKDLTELKDIKKLSFINQSEYDNYYTEDNAMTQTAILFSGSDAIFKEKEIPAGYEDGVLTAQEISFLDFGNTDIVVLSACQTGLGDIKGDGVFGLQRGFKKAGVNSILMSLWDVEDKATQILMTEFYKNYLNGKSKRESLLAAQKVVRQTPGFEDPEYWAAFILLDALN